MDSLDTKVQKIRQEELAIRDAIAKMLQNIEKIEDRKIPQKSRKAYVQNLRHRYMIELRRKHGVNSVSGRPIGENITDFITTTKEDSEEPSNNNNENDRT